VHFAGAVPKARVTKALASLERSWRTKPVTLPAYSLPGQNKGGTVYFIDVPDAKQSVLYIGKLGVAANDPAATEISYANEVMGGGTSGRLGQTLRIAKGYTYGAQSFQANAAERAPFIAVTSVRANATLPSLQIIQDMLQQYGPTFTDKEVAVTKNKVLKGSTLTYESLGAKLAMLNDISKYNRSLRFIEEDQKKLLGMKLDDYKRVIKTHFNEGDMVYLVVGDKATQLEEVRKLGKNKVVQLDIHGNPLAF